MVPHCQGAKLGPVNESLKALGRLDVGLPAGSEMHHPKHGSPASSLEPTAYASPPVVIFHCCFVAYLFCQHSFMCPHSAKWLQIPLAKGDADQPSDPLWKDPALQPIFSDASAWCIQKKNAAECKVCQYSMNKL